MQRELTFHPQIERTRDLVYSEYTSQERSIHVLLQGNLSPQHRFLLSSYRTIVTRYLSTTRIQSPVGFLRDLAGHLDELGRECGVSIDDFKALGFYVLLRAPEALYLFASRDDEVLVHTGGESIRLSQLPETAVERLYFDGAALQEELFPDTLKDGVLLYRLDADYFCERNIVLGCSEEDRSTVVDALSDPLWLATEEKRARLTSKFITRRVVALRFDRPRVGMAGSRTLKKRQAMPQRRVWAVALGAGAAAVVIGVAGLWATRHLIPSDGQIAALERSAQPVGESAESGEGQSGVVPVAEAADTTQLSEKWRRTFGDPVTSSPALHEGSVIFGCRDGNVYALDRVTGEPLWTARSAQGVGASPAVCQEQVVVADYGGNVTALSIGQGRPSWQRKLPARIVSSPSVSSDRVAVGCYDGNVYCLSIADGSVLWKHHTAGRIRGSVATAHGMFYAPSYDGYLYALDEATGEVRWRYRVEGNINSSPAADRGLVVIGEPSGAVIALDAVTGALKWKYQTDDAVKGSVTLQAGRVYVGSNDTHVYCLDAGDGSLVWKYKTGDIVLARPHVQDGVVYVGSYDGIMYGLDAETGTLLDRYQTHGEIYSSPAADAEAVFFGNNEGSFISLNHRARKAL